MREKSRKFVRKKWKIYKKKVANLLEKSGKFVRKKWPICEKKVANLREKSGKFRRKKQQICQRKVGKFARKTWQICQKKVANLREKSGKCLRGKSDKFATFNNFPSQGPQMFEFGISTIVFNLITDKHVNNYPCMFQSFSFSTKLKIQ